MPKKLIASVILLFSLNVMAKQYAAGDFVKDTLVSTKKYNSQIKKISSWGKKDRKRKRKLSSTDRVDYEHVFADDAKNLSTELIGGYFWKNNKPSEAESKGVGKDSAKLANVINKYNNMETYQSLSPQAKWIAAQLSATQVMRGILTRARPLIEKSKSDFVHSVIVTWLRGVQAGINGFNPNSEWQAGFDYLVKPFKGMDGDIETERHLYDFMRNEVMESLVLFEGRVRRLVYNEDEKGNANILNENFKPFYFDNKLLYSNMQVVDDMDRFVVIDRAEVHSLLSAINLTISSLQYSLAYDWTGLLKTMNKMAGTYGFQSYFADPGKMTAEKRIKVIRKEKGLFKLIPPNVIKGAPAGGETWTRAAFVWFKDGVREARKAWKYAEGYEYQGNQAPLLDPRAIQPFARIMNTSFDKIHTLVEGEGVRSTMIQGEELQVNFKELFDNPPKDLKSFLATNFEGGDQYNNEPSTDRKYRNYNLGNPKSWDLKVYKTYFPNIEQDGVRKTARILGQTWGAGILGAALGPVLF